jgi:hypothetical protein
MVSAGLLLAGCSKGYMQFQNKHPGLKVVFDLGVAI